MLDFKNFYKEQIRNNMELEMEVGSILRMTYRQQIQHEKTSQEVEHKMDEVSQKVKLIFDYYLSFYKI